ncbi:MAG: TIGR03032 family protein [Flavobacteriaceae bacterium]|jgi:uncharacterized protein (TIGR03032 family)|nr:TIGR03032 family protein [Flavobacteriaceae bacterium]
MSKYNITSSDDFAFHLYNSKVTLTISTYQAGRLFLIGSQDGKHLDVQSVRMRKPMGISVYNNRLAVACLNSVEIYASNDQIGRNIPFSFQKYDSFYVPRMNYVSGHLDLHDLHMHSKGIFGVNTQFNCISAFSIEHHFTPIWRPSFIDAIVPEDRCHLNGMAVHNDLPVYVSALSSGNEEGDWRKDITSTGVIINVNTNEILAEGLSMPHSPRIIDDDLFFIESAHGAITRYNRKAKSFKTFASTGAFSRGLDNVDNLLAVGRSKARESSKTFQKISREIREKPCGIDLFDLSSGKKLAWLNFGSVVDEIFDIRFINGRKNAMYGMKGTDTYEPITTPETNFWRKIPGDIIPK